MIKEGKRRPNHLTDEEKLGEWSLKQRKSLEMSKNSEKDVGSMVLGEWSQNASSSQMRDSLAQLLFLPYSFVVVISEGGLEHTVTALKL